MLDRPYARWLIDQITARMPNQIPDPEAWLAPLLRQFAAFVFDLPASDDSAKNPKCKYHHARTFGLLDHSLEAARWALTEPIPFALRMFPISAVRLMGFFGALTHDVGKVRRLHVIQRGTQATWNPDLEPLSDFAARCPDRYIHWRPDRRHTPEQFDTAEYADRFVPRALLAYLRRHFPLDRLSQIFEQWGDKAYPVSYAFMRFISAADANSREDDTRPRDLVKLETFAATCRRNAQRPRALLAPVPSVPIEDPVARELIEALLTFDLARTTSNAYSEALVESFQKLVRSPRYQLMKVHVTRPVSTIGWGYLRRSELDENVVVKRTSPDLDFRELRLYGKIRRHKPVFLAAEAARKAFHQLGLDSTRALRRARGFLASYMTDDAHLPPQLQAFLDEFTCHHGAAVDLRHLVPGALALARALRADLAAAAPPVAEIRAVLCASAGAHDSYLARAGTTLRRIYGLRLDFSDSFDSPAPPIFRTSRGEFHRPTVSYLRNLRIPDRQARAFSRAIQPLLRLRKSIAKHLRVLAQLRTDALGLSPQPAARPPGASSVAAG